MKTFDNRDWIKGAGAWLGSVFLMSIAFGVFINVEKMRQGTFPDYPSANFFDEVVGWALISVAFVAFASLIFALPALIAARSAGPLSLTKMLALGAVTGSIGACLTGAPMIAETTAGWEDFAALGLACGIVGAVAWWFLYERSRSMMLNAG